MSAGNWTDIIYSEVPSRAMSCYRNAFKAHDTEGFTAYIDGEQNVLIMADTSGSMCGRPLCTALGLAIYFAERNKGAFKDVFMTFSATPSLIQLKGCYR